MAYYSLAKYTGDGSTTDFAISYPFISRAHVHAYAGVDDANLLEVTFTWVNDGLVRLDSAPASGDLVVIKRETPVASRMVDFQDAAMMQEEDLDMAVTQVLYCTQETRDLNSVDIGAATEEAGLSADAAAASAVAAAASAGASAASAGEAAGYVGNAATEASNAASSATLAQDWADKTTGPVSGGEYSAKYWAQQAAAASGMDEHVAAADPHTQYVLESTIGQASGVAGLGSDGLVPDAQLPTDLFQALADNLTDIAGLTLTGNAGKAVVVNGAGDALVLGTVASSSSGGADLNTVWLWS